MSVREPFVKVLHVIDTLGGGGSERWVWDIVRLSDPKLTSHKVVTFFPDGYFGPFVYADRLRALGAYDGPSPSVADGLNDPSFSAVETNGNIARMARGDTVPSSGRRPNSNVPSVVKRPLVTVWNSAYWTGKRALSDPVLYVPAVFRITRALLRFKPDVVHVHGFYAFTFAPFINRLFRRPVIHTVPAMFSQMVDQGTSWLPDLYRKHHKHVERFFLVDAYRPELLSVGVPEQKLFSLRGGVDLQQVQETKNLRESHRAGVSKQLGIGQDSIILLSVGRLDTSKGHHYSLEALPLILQHFPSVHWVVLGEGSQRTELEARATELGIRGNVHLPGYVEDPLPFYAAADLFLRTNVFEGDNLSSFAAMAMGLPLVGFDTGCGWDFIPEVRSGVQVTNRDANALAAAASKILSLPDRGRERGSRGIEYCRQHLNIKRDVENFVTTYLDFQSKN